MSADTTTAPDVPLHLRRAGVSVVVDAAGPRLPRVLAWGPDLGTLSDAELADVALTARPQLVSNAPDEHVLLSVLAENAAGWVGTPGLEGHRDGSAFSTRFDVTAVRSSAGHDDPDADGAAAIEVEAADAAAGLTLVLRLELTPAGLVRQRATLASTGGDAPYTVDGLLLGLPVPPQATELLDLTGRHLRERSPQRHAFTLGTYQRDNRRGRTGTDAALVLAAGEPGFGFRRGPVWAQHVAWSGDARMIAEALPSGERVLAGGELLLPGEVRLVAGESYTTPWVVHAYGDGLDEVSGRFHAHLRAVHGPRRPRPVTLNTWEAVYFEQHLDRLTALADVAARVGVERFVLDDGWFRGRRSDHAGLGDWTVDADVWPDGLHPLVDHVHGLGMEFGLWVEPEMVNPDSDLARAHPEWVLAPGARQPMPSRHQQVLDLSAPGAYEHVFGHLDAVLREHRIDYLKWDHNRDLLEPGRDGGRCAGVHEQTLAFYRLVDALKAAHPGLEIESCSSGGGRVDLGVLERTDRIWASDCIDPLERQQIERWTSVLVPPEMTGSHVSSPRAHTTGRVTDLDTRAATAFFGHLGIEWDLGEADEPDLERLAAWVAAHRDHRDLLHTGRVVRVDHPDPAVWVHGVVAPDASAAVFAIAQRETSVQYPSGPARLPGLASDRHYRVRPLPPGDVVAGPSDDPLAWWHTEPVLSGRVLATTGLQAPTLYPARTVLLRLDAVDADSTADDGRTAP